MKRLVGRIGLGSLAVLLICSVAAAAETAAPDPGRMMLSWHAPYGMPGATSNLTLAPGDTTAEDTLFLTCVPAMDIRGFIAMTSLLRFRAAAGDSLPPYWRFGHRLDLPNVNVQSAHVAGERYNVPWRKGSSGVSNASFDTLGAGGFMVVIVAVGSTQADSMRAGVPYVLARVLFRRPAAGIAGASRPVCVEWQYAKLNPLNKPAIVIERGDRFASWNSPGCAVCSAHRGTLAPAPWKPKPRP
jgi:hypothetical protein